MKGKSPKKETKKPKKAKASFLKTMTAGRMK